jgi:hypothetical protein
MPPPPPPVVLSKPTNGQASKFVLVLATDAEAITRFCRELKAAVESSSGSTGGHTAFLPLHDGRKLGVEVVVRHK